MKGWGDVAGPSTPRRALECAWLATDWGRVGGGATWQVTSRGRYAFAEMLADSLNPERQQDVDEACAAEIERLCCRYRQPGNV